MTVEFGLLALSGATWTTSLAMFGQVPPKLLVHVFLRVDVAIDRLLADAQFGTFIDHPVADLLRRPALFDPGDHGLAQVRMADQLSLHASAFVRLELGGMTEVPRILLREGIIGSEVPFDLAMNGRLRALQDARHLLDGDFRVPPILNSTTFSQAQLRVNGSHAMISY